MKTCKKCKAYMEQEQIVAGIAKIDTLWHCSKCGYEFIIEV